MAASQIAPHVSKGALVSVNSQGAPGNVVVFQYNPESLSRTLAPRTVGGEEGGPLRLIGPPQETIKLAVEIDAVDQVGGDSTGETSIYPALSALEIMLYPSSAIVGANEALARLGVIEVIPMSEPLTLLVWDSRRILPVRVNDLSITEDSFNLQLAPVRAKVDLGLAVLSYHELGLLSPGGALFMAHQVLKEAMARIGSAGDLPGNLSTVFG